MNMQRTVYEAGGSGLVERHHALIHNYGDYAEVQDFYLGQGIDTGFMIDNHVAPFAAYVHLLDVNREFAGMSVDDQLSVIENIKTILLNPEFRASNPENLLVLKMDEVFSDLTRNLRVSARLTPEEAISCAFGAIGGAVANATGLIRDLYNVITGYNLGYSGIVRVAKSAFRTFVGGNWAGMAINFAFCAIGASFF